MAVASVNNVISSYPVTTSYKPVKSVSPIKAVNEDTNSDIAVVYEKSTTTSSDETTASSNKKTANSKVDTATIEKLKADAEERTSQLKSLVEKMFAKQGLTFTSTEEMFSILRSGDYKADPETVAAAKADIAEDGYWGIEKTSDRLVDFAKALSGGDTSKADELIDAIKKGFSQATKTFGDDLPDICQKTLDTTIDKMEQWRDGTTE